jgi:hypothetical protein
VELDSRKIGRAARTALPVVQRNAFSELIMLVVGKIVVLLYQKSNEESQLFLQDHVNCGRF